jgi:[ribosomal protein S18]-alanine N-acetyltransferase
MKISITAGNQTHSYEFRPMLSSDIEQVHTLENEIFMSPWSRHSFEVEVQLPFSHSYIMQEGTTIVAYIVAWLVEDELHITNLAVHSSYRRRGIASWLLNYLIDIAMKSACKQINLEVRKSNEEAIRLYQRFGFQIIGIRKNYYTIEHEDALLMNLKLSAN